jgi:hypothetical protein
MKTKLLSFVCAVFAVYTANATVRTVANFPPGSAQYPDVQSAVTAANAGDTIYVNGSPTPYNSGGVTINKQLVIIGTGYADSAEGNLNSIISGNVILDTLKTVPQSGSSGCQFMGISFTGQVYSGNRAIGGSDVFEPKNIFFSGCYFSNNLYVENDGWVIQNCMFYAGCSTEIAIDYSPVNSCIIQNNFFGPAPCNGNAFGFNPNPTLAPGLIINHNFFEDYFGGNACQYAIIQNNVFFFANAATSANLQNCQISNNLFYNNALDSLPTGTGGTANTVHNNYVTQPTNYQVNNTVSAQIAYPALLADSWQLRVTSLGHNAATDATDCGPFGGYYPINMNGSPIPPQMFQMNLSSLVPINDTLKVQFEARQQKQ